MTDTWENEGGSMSTLDPNLTNAFEAGYQAANENARHERGDMQATIEGLQDELREVGVAFERLAKAAKEAAAKLRLMANLLPEGSQYRARVLAAKLEDATEVAK